ncbi:MAG: alpha/beta hydrolase [Acidimicrobiia bacterium]
MQPFTLRILLSFTLVALLAACSGSSGEAADTTVGPATTAAPTTTTVAPTTTTTAPTTTTTSAPMATTTTIPDAAFTETEGFTYLTIDGEALEGDIYVPEGEGPWPVVVMFHGYSWVGKDDSEITVVAEAAAAAGMRVFVPDWPMVTDVFMPEFFDPVTAIANCAVAYAQPDPDDSVPIVVYGFSAGAVPASFAALSPASEPIPGCVAVNPPAPITGAVLGDSEYFLRSTLFDPAFDADQEAMQAGIAEMVDPSHWPPDMETRFFLWAVDCGPALRTFDDPWDETGWLAQRDPDGSIRDDLDRLGQLDDGVISAIDEAELLGLRLEEAGIEVNVERHPGGHTSLDKVPELVDYLTQAAGIS